MADQLDAAMMEKASDLIDRILKNNPEAVALMVPTEILRLAASALRQQADERRAAFLLDKGGA